MAKKRFRKKTGKEWHDEETFGFVIENPKGWPEGTWDTEKITKEEFLFRALKSNINSN